MFGGRPYGPAVQDWGPDEYDLDDLDDLWDGLIAALGDEQCECGGWVEDHRIGYLLPSGEPIILCLDEEEICA